MCGILINVNLLLWKWRRGSAWYLISFLGPGSIRLCRKIYAPFLTAWLSSKLRTHECPWKLSLHSMHAYPKKEGRRCCHLKQKGSARLHRDMKWVVEEIGDWLGSECSDSKNRVQGGERESRREGPGAAENLGNLGVLDFCEPSCQLTHCWFWFWIICPWTHVLELTLLQKWEVTSGCLIRCRPNFSEDQAWWVRVLLLLRMCPSLCCVTNCPQTQ